MRQLLWTVVISGSLWAPLQAIAQSQPVEPLPFFNQSPLQMIFGLPAAHGPRILDKNKQSLTFNLDFSSHFVSRSPDNESLTLDGETTRAAIIYRRGLGHGLEANIEVPFIDHSGGFADSAIDWFHDASGTSDSGRSNFPEDRQLYRYRRDGQTLLLVDDSPSGLGDIRLGISKNLNLQGNSIASISAQLELPTGDADKLTGSESIDLSAWGTIGRANFLFEGFSIVGAAGALYTTQGEVLENQRQQSAGFGWLTLGYAWSPRLILKAQLYVHTPLYKGSRLDAVDDIAVQGGAGFAWHFTPATRLDWSIIEDLNQGASPDVTFNLSIRQGF